MSDNTVDTLSLQIKSDADKALRSLESLTGKLKTLSSSLNNVNSSATHFSKGINSVVTSFNAINGIKTNGLDNAISKLNTLSKIDLSNLKNQSIDIKLNVSNEKNNIQYAIDKTLSNVKVDTNDLSSQIIQSFNLKGGAASKLRSQMETIAESMVQGFNGKMVGMDKSAGNAIDSIFEVIKNSGSVSKSQLDDTFTYAEQELRDFYNEFKNKKIYVSDMLKASTGKSEFQDLLSSSLRNVTRDQSKADIKDLNSSWSDIVSRYPTLFSEETANDGEQLIKLLEQIKVARDSIKPIDISSLSGESAIKADDIVGQEVIGAVDQLGNKLKDRLNNTMSEANGKLAIDVDVNTDKITLDIQKAINKVAELKYNAVRVSLDVDVSAIKDAVTTKLNSIDAGQMDTLANGMGHFTNSLQALGNVNFKESGLNAILNSITRLSTTDISTFDTTKLGEIINKISTLSSIPDVSTSVNRFVSSLARLASSGSSIGTVTSQLTLLGTNLKIAAEKIISIGDVSESMNRFVEAISKLASSGNKTGQTASQLGSLTTAVRNFFEVMKDAPTINSDTIRMTEALAQVASSGNKVSSATNSMSSAMDKTKEKTDSLAKAIQALRNSFKSVVASMTSGVKKIASGIKSLASSNSSVQTVALSFKNLLSIAMKFGVLRTAFNWGKQAVTLGSDITEVENVVDTAFGSMADKAYDFASTASQQFGLSELAAKTYSGTMMAMMKSSGVAQSAASDMSITLAGLAGDLASFYNIDTDTAFYKIRAGISGEIEPLKQLGINMSVANMEAYALTQGITKSYSAMSQAEKTTLRYNYLMSVTGDQQGDFARTSSTWANQVRLLTLNLQSLAAVLGQGIIAGILPAIQALNAFMSKLMQAANVFRNFMYVLMGKKLKGSTKGIVNDVSTITDTSTGLENLGTTGDDASTGLDNATDSAQELKKALSVLSFDELNQLTDNSSTSSGTGGTGTGSSGIGDSGLDTGLSDLSESIDDALSTEETPINKWASKIRKAFLAHDWEGLGATIADMLNIGMQKIYDVINWNKVGKKITAFCDAFTRTFNSLVDNIDWNLMGRTVGAGINTIVNTLNLLLGNINWVNLGSKFATGIQGLVTETNWTNLGNAIGNAFMVSWNIFSGFVHNLPYAEIGRAFADTLDGVFDTISFTAIADTLATGLNGAFTTLATFANTFKWNDLVDNITGGISTFLSTFQWKENGAKLEQFIDKLLESLVSIAKTTDWELFGHDVGVFLSEIDWGQHLAQLGEVLLDVLGGIWKGLGTTSAGKFLQTIAVFEVGSKLLPFVNKISEFFTGSTVTSKISTAIKNMLSPALTTAANTTIPVFGTSLASLVGTAGGITLAVSGTVALVKGIANIVDAMQGGNGMTTQYGGYLHDYATELQNYANITNEQANALWELIETDEEKGISHDQMYSDMIAKLQEYGVSATQAQTALEQYGAQAGVSAEFVSGMTEQIKSLGDGISESASKFDTSKIPLYDFRDTIYDLTLKSGDLQGVYSTLLTQLNTGIENGTYTSTAQAIDLVYTAIKNAGGSTEELNRVLTQEFPMAAETTKTVSTTISGAQQQISSSMQTASRDTSTATQQMSSSVSSDMASITSAADQAMSSVSNTTTTNWGNSSREATLKAREMKNAVSTELSNMDESVRSHFTSQYNIAYDKWQNMSRDISSYVSRTMSGNIGSALDRVVETIKNKFSNLYSVGQNAMSQLALGMRNTHISTPHMYMNMSTYGSGTSRSYSWNSGVDWYAKGGLFNGASIIGVGEAGREAVLPLENKRTMSMIADSIVDSSNGSSMGLSQDEITLAIERGVVNALMNNSSALQGSSPQYIMNSITLNGKELAKAVTKAQNEQNYRMSPSLNY